MHPTLKIYSAFSRFGFIILLILGILAAGQFIYVDGWIGFSALPAISLILWIIYMMWWAPLLVVTENVIVAFNVWRRVRIPWNEFLRAKANLGLILETTAGDFRLSAAQPKNRLRELRNPDVDPVPHIDFSKPSVSLHLHTQQAVELLNDWKQLHNDYDALPTTNQNASPEKSASNSKSSQLPKDSVTVSYMWHHIGVLAGLVILNLTLWIF
ncbi:hypothetical protein HMPREF0044_0637 [Gleimia coleocanis DSM 15436]|uniref:Uncharacterized protein n=1 Tax=Gleimia coleocanis DSM 15436 TaxID=525245 RepID=C0W0P4_9ACTO|nr:hypothetical protein [Gleimia coleocanis]EEH63618.1 hypothetical protein HMPREF0044_0637 [Gleimia coleocanis DSM 15436]